MAHILVYLQRTPQGIHPGSMVGLCLARDIGSERGASITAVALGDHETHNQRVCAAAGRFGADTLYFSGSDGLAALYERLQPISVLVPYTDEGLEIAEMFPEDKAVPRWLSESDHGWGSADPITAVIAGTLTWYDLPTVLDPEITGDAAEHKLEDWLVSDSSRDSRQLQYLAPTDIDPGTKATLASLGARPAPEGYQDNHNSGTLLVLSSAGEPLPEGLANRSPGARVIFFPGEVARFHKSWLMADWVLPGAWQEALNNLHSELWKPALA